MSFTSALPPVRHRGELTERQRCVYAFVRDYIKAAHCSPSVVEIAQHFDFCSLNAVQCHLDAIIKKGWLRRHRNSGAAGRIGRTARSLRLA